MAGSRAVYIGIRGTVLALDPATGTELWRVVVKGAQFVNVALVDDRLYASAGGEMFALDPATGQILWNNKLKGLGMGIMTIAGSSQSPQVAELRQRQAQAAAAAGATAAGRA
jgi:outer membrane protein assembly factor BamB